MTPHGNRQMKSEKAPGKSYQTVAMGGTFDVLHSGHKRLLKNAFAIGRRVMIGVTTDDFARSLHKPHKIDGYARRKSDLEGLLKRWGVLSRSRIVPLHDRYGPTLNATGISALVVSRRTFKTACELNGIRRRKGLKPLAVIPVELLLADDKKPISSTRIRRGRIDRRGRLIGLKRSP